MSYPKLSRVSRRERELLVLLDSLEIAASDMMRRWDDGDPIDAKVRAEIAVRIYEPILQRLIDAGLRPIPREASPI